MNLDSWQRPFLSPRRLTMREELAERLRGAIITGQLPPGEVHTVPTLAKRFGVSITPVREAVLDLAKEGLVSIVKNKGFRVVELTDEELDEITGLRMLLEVPAVVAQVGKLPHERVVELRHLAEAIVLAAQQEDLPAYLAADSAFHAALLAGYGNKLLVETVTDLRRRTRLYGLDSLVHTGKLVDSAAEHVELVDLMETGRSADVRRLIQRHLSHVRGIWAGKQTN